MDIYQKVISLIEYFLKASTNIFILYYICNILVLNVYPSLVSFCYSCILINKYWLIDWNKHRRVTLVT